MRIWIDTEFNSYKGELISMALVDEAGREWYEVLSNVEMVIDPWVARHVMPILGKASISESLMQRSLERFLAAYPEVHIVADWPEDISKFCAFLITGPGMRIDTPSLTMEVRRDLDAVSAIPHNALEDAKAMRLVHMAIERGLNHV